MAAGFYQFLLIPGGNKTIFTDEGIEFIGNGYILFDFIKADLPPNRIAAPFGIKVVRRRNCKKYLKVISMKFNYQLSGIGWAEVEIEINNQNTYCNPSYISEPLIDLINGLVSITPGCIADDELKDEVTFEWNEEPGGDIWYLKRVNNKDLMVKIISYSNLFNKDQSTVRVDLDTICDLEEFIRSEGIMI